MLCNNLTLLQIPFHNIHSITYNTTEYEQVYQFYLSNHTTSQPEKTILIMLPFYSFLILYIYYTHKALLKPKNHSLKRLILYIYKLSYYSSGCIYLPRGILLRVLSYSKVLISLLFNAILYNSLCLFNLLVRTRVNPWLLYCLNQLPFTSNVQLLYNFFQSFHHLIYDNHLCNNMHAYLLYLRVCKEFLLIVSLCIRMC